MMGYYKQPELTAEAFSDDGFLKTGDRGEIDDEGRLKLTGREKELFKTSKGKYIAPSRLENLINADSLVEICCVTGAGRPQPFALVLLSPEATETASQEQLQQRLASLLGEVNARVEPHEKLEFLAVITQQWSPENGLLTPTLKVKRGAIEQRYEYELDSWYAADCDIVWC